MDEALPDDPWHKYYQAPVWLKALIDRGALGQKTKAGFFRKVGKDIEVLDPATQTYRPSKGEIEPEVAAILALKTPAEQFARLRAHAHPQAQFLWAIFRDLFHYCAYHLATIADNARDVDLAIRWGFGWKMGPFETWQAAGWRQVAEWIAADVAAGKALAAVVLPDWVTTGPAAAGVHTREGSYSPATDTFHPRSKLRVYARQYFPDPVLGEKPQAGTTILETDAVRMWHTGDDIAIVSFKTKQHTIRSDVLDGLLAAIAEAERNWRGLVLWQTSEPFSLGADLASLGPTVQAGEWDTVEAIVAKFQQTSQRLRYSMVPTVAAVRGMALGGACEFIMHCDRAVAALESYIGLVEAGVGLLPAGGGCKELALRAAQEVARGSSGGQLDLSHLREHARENVRQQGVGAGVLERAARRLADRCARRRNDIRVLHLPGHVISRQLRSGLPVLSVWAMRSCVLGFLSSAMNSRRSRSRSHFSSTRLPGSTSPPHSTRAMRSPTSKSCAEMNPPSRMLTSIISSVAMPVLPATGMPENGSGGR